MSLFYLPWHVCHRDLGHVQSGPQINFKQKEWEKKKRFIPTQTESKKLWKTFTWLPSPWLGGFSHRMHCSLKWSDVLLCSNVVWLLQCPLSAVLMKAVLPRDICLQTFKKYGASQIVLHAEFYHKTFIYNLVPKITRLWRERFIFLFMMKSLHCF